MQTFPANASENTQSSQKCEHFKKVMNTSTQPPTTPSPLQKKFSHVHFGTVEADLVPYYADFDNHMAWCFDN